MNQQQYVQPGMQPQYTPAPQQPVQPQQPVTAPQSSVFDEGESEVTTGSSGLTVEHGTHYCVIWGIVSYKGYDFTDKNKIIDKKLIVVQFPTCLDPQTGKPQVGVVFANSSFGPKSNLHKWIKEIFGRTIGTEDPLRLPNGNLDTTKITGVNCFAVIGNTSKTEGETRTGILSFAKPPAGSQQYQLDTTLPIPEFIIELKNGKEISSRQNMPPVGAPTIPQQQTQAPQQVQPANPQPVAPNPQQPVQPQVQPVQQPPAPPQGAQTNVPPVGNPAPAPQPQPVPQQGQGIQQQTQGMLQANAINF